MILLNYKDSVIRGQTITPICVFELALKIIQINITSTSKTLISKYIFEWLKVKWIAIWHQQQLLLKEPNRHFSNINKAFSIKNTHGLKMFYM